MSFRRKTYPEVAESLLNRLLGGVERRGPPLPAGQGHARALPPRARAPAGQPHHRGVGRAQRRDLPLRPRGRLRAVGRRRRARMEGRRRPPGRGHRLRDPLPAAPARDAGQLPLPRLGGAHADGGGGARDRWPVCADGDGVPRRLPRHRQRRRARPCGGAARHPPRARRAQQRRAALHPRAQHRGRDHHPGRHPGRHRRRRDRIRDHQPTSPWSTASPRPRSPRATSSPTTTACRPTAWC